ncbi:hypothetical protein PAPYR_6162 [Paratrimastix pyriformis]|uniref:Uncharacterized protein n=1 Tax=Paratrimastix pyriformis TaxID=342808 RepID=A0ABQ8UG00_9EUKA|nr:hypothetical protein PAPYR_6162 [Paratrimastix pyriformis]
MTRIELTFDPSLRALQMTGEIVSHAHQTIEHVRSIACENLDKKFSVDFWKPNADFFTLSVRDSNGIFVPMSIQDRLAEHRPRTGPFRIRFSVTESRVPAFARAGMEFLVRMMRTIRASPDAVKLLPTHTALCDDAFGTTVSYLKRMDSASLQSLSREVASVAVWGPVPTPLVIPLNPLTRYDPPPGWIDLLDRKDPASCSVLELMAELMTNLPAGPVLRRYANLITGLMLIAMFLTEGPGLPSAPIPHFIPIHLASPALLAAAIYSPFEMGGVLLEPAARYITKLLRDGWVDDRPRRPATKPSASCPVPSSNPLLKHQPQALSAPASTASPIPAAPLTAPSFSETVLSFPCEPEWVASFVEEEEEKRTRKDSSIPHPFRPSLKGCDPILLSLPLVVMGTALKNEKLRASLGGKRRKVILNRYVREASEQVILQATRSGDFRSAELVGKVLVCFSKHSTLPARYKRVKTVARLTTQVLSPLVKELEIPKPRALSPGGPPGPMTPQDRVYIFVLAGYVAQMLANLATHRIDPLGNSITMASTRLYTRLRALYEAGIQTRLPAHLKTQGPRETSPPTTATTLGASCLCSFPPPHLEPTTPALPTVTMQEHIPDHVVTFHQALEALFLLAMQVPSNIKARLCEASKKYPGHKVFWLGPQAVVARLGPSATPTLLHPETAQYIRHIARVEDPAWDLQIVAHHGSTEPSSQQENTRPSIVNPNTPIPVQPATPAPSPVPSDDEAEDMTTDDEDDECEDHDTNDGKPTLTARNEDLVSFNLRSPDVPLSRAFFWRHCPTLMARLALLDEADRSHWRRVLDHRRPLIVQALAVAEMGPVGGADPIVGADPLPIVGADPLPIVGADPLPIVGADSLALMGADPMAVEGADPMVIEGAELAGMTADDAGMVIEETDEKCIQTLQRYERFVVQSLPDPGPGPDGPIPETVVARMPVRRLLESLWAPCTTPGFYRCTVRSEHANFALMKPVPMPSPFPLWRMSTYKEKARGQEVAPGLTTHDAIHLRIVILHLGTVSTMMAAFPRVGAELPPTTQDSIADGLRRVFVEYAPLNDVAVKSRYCAKTTIYNMGHQWNGGPPHVSQVTSLFDHLAARVAQSPYYEYVIVYAEGHLDGPYLRCPGAPSHRLSSSPYPAFAVVGAAPPSAHLIVSSLGSAPPAAGRDGAWQPGFEMRELRDRVRQLHAQRSLLLIQGCALDTNPLPAAQSHCPPPLALPHKPLLGVMIPPTLTAPLRVATATPEPATATAIATAPTPATAAAVAAQLTECELGQAFVYSMRPFPNGPGRYAAQGVVSLADLGETLEQDPVLFYGLGTDRQGDPLPVLCGEGPSPPPLPPPPLPPPPLPPPPSPALSLPSGGSPVPLRQAPPFSPLFRLFHANPSPFRNFNHTARAPPTSAHHPLARWRAT